MNFYQKYNFVYLWYPISNDYGHLSLFDIHNLVNVRVLSINTHRGNDGNFYVNFSPLRSQLNPYAFNKPITSLDFKNYFDSEFPVKQPIVWIILGEWYRWMKPTGYLKYLKNYYPDSKLVLSLTNPVHTYQRYCGMFINEKNIRDIKDEFDCILTYNQNDAVNFGLTYYIGGYSILPVKSQPETSDIFFIGAAKDRLDQIYDIYSYLTGNGFKCDFHITDVPQELQKFPQEIHYNKRLAYLEVLNHVIRSRGVLEMAQGGTYGLTMRFFEALVYDKNFITNNGFLNQEKFLKSPKLFYVPKYQKFHIDKEKYFTAAKLSNNYKKEYSPIRFLEFLEDFFNFK